jgi:hypothetical protein
MIYSIHLFKFSIAHQFTFILALKFTNVHSFDLTHVQVYSCLQTIQIYSCSNYNRKKTHEIT